MRKFAAVACLTLGLAVPGVASAAPVGLVGCGFGSAGELVCDISVDDVTGYTLLNDATAFLGFPPGWLVGYTFLLNTGANLTNGIQDSEVAQALVFHSDRIELYTSLFSGFSSIVSSALFGEDIDETSLSSGQIVGESIGGGSRQYSGVGLFDTAALVTMNSQIAWSDGVGGGYDTLRVHTIGETSPEPVPAPIPEPGSLSLLALGITAFASARRRRRAGKTA